MSNRAARIASVIFASVLAGAAITTISHLAANAAEACRTEPGDQTPDGKHWRYRIEHPGNRQCWYLRDIGGRPPQGGSAQQSDKAVEPRAESPAPQRSLADAHAEYPWPQPRIEQNNPANIPQRPQATPADAANAPAEPRPNVLESTTRGSLIGTRWPDPSAANPAVGSQAATPETVAEAQPNQQTTPAQAAAPAALATADAAPVKPTGSLQTLLLVVAGALALAGLTASAIFRLSRRRSARPAARGRRRVVWETADGARPSAARRSPPQTPPNMPPWGDPDQFARRPGIAPGFHESRDHNESGDNDERLDKISEMLERMSKQPTN
jgi:hypothetical protein